MRTFENHKGKNLYVGHKQWITIDDCVRALEGHISINLSPQSNEIMEKSYDVLKEALEANRSLYGITTQYGGDAFRVDVHPTSSQDNSSENIEDFKSRLHSRQKNLIRSLMCGVGEEIHVSFVRMTILLRLHTLSQGYSGVRPIITEQLINLLHKKIYPVIKRYGSIGASGDLVPMASIAATLMGEKDQEVLFDGKRENAHAVLQKCNLKPIELGPKEGLALVNGTSFMTSIMAVSLYNLKRNFNWMLLAIGLSLEALQVIDDAYDPIVHKLKRHTGECVINNFLNNFWKGSALIKSPESFNRKDNRSVQDVYSLRSVSQGFGPFYENIRTATTWTEREMNSINDNPIIDPTSRKISGTANFMGYYITSGSDMLRSDIAQASSWLHALLANLVHPRKNNSLPANLIEQPEIYSGFKPVQVLAASLAVQNRKLASTHQAYMIPTEGDNQDVNSLGTHAAFDLSQVVENLEFLTSILMLAGTQALELRGSKKASEGSQILLKKIRSVSPFLTVDRPLTQDIEAIVSLIRAEKPPYQIQFE